MCIRKRGRIRHRRSRCDCGRIVARNVRNRQRDDFGRLAGAREPAALDPRQVLAHRVDLADRRARAQQRPGQELFLRERYALGRRDPVRRAAARQQHQHEIVVTGILCQSQTLLRALQPGLVGHRMTGFDHPDPSRRHAMAVAGGRNAQEPLRVQFQCIEIMPLRGCGHRGRALSRPNTDDAALRHGTQMRR